MNIFNWNLSKYIQFYMVVLNFHFQNVAVKWKNGCKSNFMFFVKYFTVILVPYCNCFTFFWSNWLNVNKSFQNGETRFATFSSVFKLFCCFWCCNNFIHFDQSLLPVILIFCVFFFARRKLLPFLELSRCLIMKWANAILLNWWQQKN